MGVSHHVIVAGNLNENKPSVLKRQNYDRLKSNALYGLALGEIMRNGGICGWAKFNGKSKYLELGWPEPEGNHEFVI